MEQDVQSFALSDVGCVRTNNEDVFKELPEFGFYVVADGMGGHRAGEVASKEAVDAFCTLVTNRFSQVAVSEHSLEEAKQFITESIELINSIVYSIGCSDPNLKGMGTTLICILVHPEGLILGHVGDSRAYCLRGGKLKLLTEDDTLACELIDKGHLDPEDQAGFAYKNVITKAIGNGELLNPCVQHFALKQDDIYLLCTDGLTDMLSQNQIQIVLQTGKTLKDMAFDLIDVAKSLGGKDNVTVLLVKPS